MCSRYHVDNKTIAEIQKIVSIVEKGALTCSGEIHPSDNAPVIDNSTAGLRLRTMTWGFTKADGKGLLINARAETADQKPAFRESLTHRRCVIPASRFYEWDKAKRKASFSRLDSPLLCLAGLYRVDKDGPRFVILTTEANESVLPVHDRMPLIIGREQIPEWIYDDSQTQTILRQKMSPMMRQLEQKTQRASELYLFPDFER
jgi:putative SOS response-associated peptidase YedK